MEKAFLPTSFKEGTEYYRNFDQFDVVLITGDPYYDHPLNGSAIIARLLDSNGYKVGIIPQPITDEDYQVCGRPKYFFCITSGLLDSMLANYTPMLHQRKDVLVPERALMVYTQKAKEFYKGCITVLGGVEATIRRFTHFDYKSNELRRGILNDTKADLLLFGNADRSILTLLDRIKKAKHGKGKTDLERVSSVIDLFTINGLSFRVKKKDIDESVRKLPSFEECVEDKKKFSLLTRTHYLLPDDSFIEPCGLGFIQHNRLQHTLQEAELDYVYELPFTRKLHPKAKNFNTNNGMVARLETSVILGRGCWGSCNFCVIPLVQGKNIAKRSKKSILREIENLYKDGFEKIADLTLPTINMYGSYCSLYDSPEVISSPIIKKEITVFNKKKYCNQQCVGCENRVLSNDLIPLLNDVKILHKKYRGTSLELRSAIRHDIILEQEELFKSIMEFINRLKIAPEHINDNVLKQMNKGDRKDFVKFLELYDKVNLNKKNLVPYFVAAHPGTTKEDMQDLKKFCDENKLYVNLTQVFTPTPGTASTSMYYTAENPLTKEEVYVARTFREKKDQKNILLIDDELIDDNA
ncbi:MAG: DUF3362 domain-containing protein [Nanoarchaeota archaeon]|nr:DUF3362 domain-containing protein [Nanoarchaeota archaeon]